uniref:Uncharacterized protein n=1 Tax=Globisporangium ultimum (strain ATCC 200006 / CBS 805.95 / DAOM BR144) TaxID=431595 RepID=K3WE06_GLOUD
MLLEKTQEYDKRVRALRKRLALDFRPLKDTLSKGLEVLIDPEAAVYCTATVEAFCDALFNVIIKELHEEAATGVAPLDTKITVYHIQVVLRGHADFAQLLQSVESVMLVLEYFLDDATSKALYDRHLIATRDAKHLRTATDDSTSEEELIRMHARTRAEWQKREDDPFSEVDFAMVLKCVHPAFTLSYNATILLSAVIRELLNEVCDLAQVDLVQRRVPPEFYLEDIEMPISRIFHVGDAMGKQIAKTGLDCLERFRLRSRKGTTLTIRFRVFPGANAAQNFRITPQYTLNNVARETSFTQLVPQMCKKCHVDATAMAAIYRGHQVDLLSTPHMLSMPTGAIVYLVAKKWWDHTRRNEARRGLLSSLRPQDAQLKSLVEATESKVKKKMQVSPAASVSSHLYGLQLGTAVMRRDDSLDAKCMQQRSNNSNSTSSLQSVASTISSSSGTTASPMRSSTNMHAKAMPSPVAKSLALAEPKERSVFDKDNPSSSACADASEDSLSLLLKTRARNGMTMPQPHAIKPPRARQSSSDNNVMEASERDALSKMEVRLERQKSRVTVRALATKNAQLMVTLDDAWLGFAAISGGVRSMNDKVAKWKSVAAESEPQQEREMATAAAAAVSAKELEELEDELRARLDKTEELVVQTLAAKVLVAELVDQVRHLRNSQ